LVFPQRFLAFFDLLSPNNLALIFSLFFFSSVVPQFSYFASAPPNVDVTQGFQRVPGRFFQWFL